MLAVKYNFQRLIYRSLSKLLIQTGEEQLYLISKLFCAGQQVIVQFFFPLCCEYRNVAIEFRFKKNWKGFEMIKNNAKGYG